MQIQAAFSTDRKLAIHLILNALQRNQAKLVPKQPHSPIQALELLIATLEHMGRSQPGRYHGADAFACKFAGDNGIDILVRLARDGDPAVRTGALRALVLLCASLESRQAEPSHAEALHRFDVRKLAIKAGAVPVLIGAVARGGAEAQRLALDALRGLLTFPDHWTSLAGRHMSAVFSDAAAAILAGGGLPAVLAPLSAAPPAPPAVLLSCLALVHAMMLADNDAAAPRQSADVLGDALFIAEGPPAPPPLRRSAGGGLEAPPPPPTSSRAALLECGGVAGLCKAAAGRPVRGDLRVSALSARRLPRADRMGESDPFCVLFVEGREVGRTEARPDTAEPEWGDAAAAACAVGDVACAVLTVMVFDADEGGESTFMAAAALPLAELVASAAPAVGAVAAGPSDADAAGAGPGVDTRGLTAAEVLAALGGAGRTPAAGRAVGRGRVAWDGWLELSDAGGARPRVPGGLGLLHLAVEVDTEYVHDPGELRVRKRETEPQRAGKEAERESSS